jgi:hypothetical protein
MSPNPLAAVECPARLHLDTRTQLAEVPAIADASDDRKRLQLHETRARRALQFFREPAEAERIPPAIGEAGREANGESVAAVADDVFLVDRIAKLVLAWKPTLRIILPTLSLMKSPWAWAGCGSNTIRRAPTRPKLRILTT